MIETTREILRHWKKEDASRLFRLASDKEVGPPAGWPPHKDIEESLSIINNVLNGKECYAIVLKESGQVIGDIELMLDNNDKEDECELGYWLGREYWGNGYMNEAIKAMLHHAFIELHMNIVWCAYYLGNLRSKKVQEKVGFIFHRLEKNKEVPPLKEYRDNCVNYLIRETYMKLYMDE